MKKHIVKLPVTKRDLESVREVILNFELNVLTKSEERILRLLYAIMSSAQGFRGLKGLSPRNVKLSQRLNKQLRRAA